MNVDSVIDQIIMPKFRARIRRSILINFRVGGRPAWIPSHRSEERHTSKKDGKSHAGRTLVDTAILQNSIIVKTTGKYEITAGTPVAYARIHDLGGTINQAVSVKAHDRTISQAFGHPIPETIVHVKAHNRQVTITIPQRQFFMLQKDDLSYFVSLADEAMNNINIGGK